MLFKFTKKVFTGKFSYASSLKFYHTTNSLKQEQSLFNEQFLSGSNCIYLEQMYDNWSKDRLSVHPAWDTYFSNLSKGISGPTLQPLAPDIQQSVDYGASIDVKQKIRDSLRVFLLIKSYMRRGHEIAEIDPLRRLIDT